MLEPLLQHLQAGRGYQPHFAPETPVGERPEHATSAALCDDVALIAESIPQMQSHLRKLEKYCAWAGITCSMDTGKTQSTCLEHNSPPDQRERLESLLQINGKPIHFEPKDHPYKYLGIHFTLDLKGNHQLQSLLDKLDSNIATLQASALYGNDVWHLITTNLFPKAQYGLALGLYTKAHIETLETRLNKALRKSNRFQKSFPNAAILTFSRNVNCMGVASLTDIYCKDAAEALLRSVRDTGRLGKLYRQVFLQHINKAKAILEDQPNASPPSPPTSNVATAKGKRARATKQPAPPSLTTTGPILCKMSTHSLICRTLSILRDHEIDSMGLCGLDANNIHKLYYDQDHDQTGVTPNPRLRRRRTDGRNIVPLPYPCQPRQPE